VKTKTKSKSKKLWIVVVLVAAGTLAYGYGVGGWFAKKATTELRGAPVRRGPLRISVVQRGNLAAKDSVSVESEIEGQTTVLFLIPEGTSVKPGDLLVELDASDLVEKKRQQEIAVQNAEAAYVKAKAQYEIQESQNKSDIEAAERKLNFAELDKQKYLDGDRIQLVDQAQDKILLAESKRTQAGNTKEWSEKLLEKGYVTKSDMERDKLDFESAEVQLKEAKAAKNLLEQYEDRRKKIELDANVEEAKRGLERTKLRAEATIVDFEAGRNTSKARLELEEQRLKKWLDQIAKARIVSKWSGMVVYSRVESGRMGMGEPIQKGSQVRERQEILTIPRTGGMIAEASIHESVLKQVLPQLPCTLSIDAMPGQQFSGRVNFVALLPDKGSWWANPNQRLYKTEITLDEVNPEMRPGMSCNIEILTQEIPDALFVPLQSVLTQKGDTIAFVTHGDDVEQRAVKVGRNNDKWVEVTDGLNEGDVVLLGPPPGFVPEGKEQGEAVGAPGDRRAGEHAGRGPVANAPAMRAGVEKEKNGAAAPRTAESSGAPRETSGKSSDAPTSRPAVALEAASAPDGARHDRAGEASHRPADASSALKPGGDSAQDRATDGAAKNGASVQLPGPSAERASEKAVAPRATEKAGAATSGESHGSQR
jgi:HlyD family secretion protein